MDLALRLGALQERVKNHSERVEKYNTCHSPASGEFCSGGGGSSRPGRTDGNGESLDSHQVWSKNDASIAFKDAVQSAAEKHGFSVPKSKWVGDTRQITVEPADGRGFAAAVVWRERSGSGYTYTFQQIGRAHV